MTCFVRLTVMGGNSFAMCSLFALLYGITQTRVSAVVEKNLVNCCTTVHEITFENAYNRWMTLKVTQGHQKLRYTCVEWSRLNFTMVFCIGKPESLIIIAVNLYSAFFWNTSNALSGQVGTRKVQFTWLVERRCRRPWTLNMGWQRDDKYPGAILCRHLNTWTQTLNRTQSTTSSQWSWLRRSWRNPRSYLSK